MADRRLVMVDNEGYKIEASDNWYDLEETRKKYALNNNLDAVFVMVESPYGEQQCVAITVEQAERLAEFLQSLTKAIKG